MYYYGGGFYISQFGLFLLLLVTSIFVCMKTKKKRSGRYIFTVLVAIIFGFAMLEGLPGGHPGQGLSEYINLRIQRDAIHDYVRAHGKLPMEENLLLSLAPYLQDRGGYTYEVWMAPYTFLRVTPNATWVGCDLAEYRPVETWWEIIWQGRNENLVLREGLAKRAARVLLYGSKDALTPPESDDVKNLYTKEDNAIWLRVDHLYKEDVLQ